MEQDGLARAPRLALWQLVGPGGVCRFVRRRHGKARGVHGSVQGFDTHGRRTRNPGWVFQEAARARQSLAWTLPAWARRSPSLRRLFIGAAMQASVGGVSRALTRPVKKNFATLRDQL